MNMTLRAIALAVAILATPAPAAGQDAQLAAGVFCDTADQARTFAERYTGSNAIEALASANGTFGAGACGPMTVVMRPAGEVARVTSAGKTYAVVRVEILSVRHPAGGFFVTLPEPYVQFTLMAVAEQGT